MKTLNMGHTVTQQFIFCDKEGEKTEEKLLLFWNWSGTFYFHTSMHTHKQTIVNQ